MDKKRLTWGLLAAGFGVAYAISPIDLLPDVLGIVGLADDAAVVTASFAFAARMLLGARGRQIEAGASPSSED